MGQSDLSFEEVRRAFLLPCEIVLTVLTALLGAASWLVWLPWHAVKQLNPDGFETGPYTSHQVESLILTVCLIAFVGGWLKLVFSTGLGLALGMTVVFSADAATQVSRDADIWPVGAVFLLIGGGAGLCLVAFTSLLARQTLTRYRRWRALH
jgi:hypothetical protein